MILCGVKTAVTLLANLYGQDLTTLENQPHIALHAVRISASLICVEFQKIATICIKAIGLPKKIWCIFSPIGTGKAMKAKNVPVFVYTNGDGAELFLNGKSLGKKFKKPQSDVSTERYRLMWKDVIYEPGELKAVAYKNGGVIGEAVVKTAGAPYSIKLTPDRSQLDASGDDLSYILVEAYDKDGNLCPLADNLINFKLKGPAEIAGVGNGNPQSHEPFVANYRKLFYGKAMLIVRTVKDKTGKIEVSASSDGLKGTTVDLSSK